MHTDAEFLPALRLSIGGLELMLLFPACHAGLRQAHSSTSGVRCGGPKSRQQFPSILKSGYAAPVRQALIVRSGCKLRTQLSNVRGSRGQLPGE